jgi:Na+-transporting methylmalonyl-CoA/oxaloacetate decarboxylase gamma subunit
VSALSAVLPGAPLLVAGQSTPTPPPAPASGQEFGSASTLGFVVLVLFFIAVAFLARSMAKHLKRIQKPFEEAAEAEAERAAQAEDSGDATPAEESAPATRATEPTEPADAPQPKADA